MIEVFLDTNTVYRANFFRSAFAEGFLKGAKFLGIKVLIPELVIDETKANFKSKLKKKLNQYHSNLGKLIVLSDPQIILDEEVIKYNNFLDNLLKKHGVGILPYPETPVKELVEKSYEAKKPFKAKGEGYKDYVIWQTIKDYCDNRQNYKQKKFITADKDFYETHSDGTVALHHELIATLKDAIKAPKVILSLKDFFDQELKPSLIDVDSEDIPNFNMQETVETILENALPNYSIYRLKGLAFDEDLDIICVTDEPEIDDFNISEVNKDDVLIDVEGTVEIEVQGSMSPEQFYGGDDGIVGYVQDEMSGPNEDGDVDHWIVVSQEISVSFELSIVYSKKDKKITNSTINLP